MAKTVEFFNSTISNDTIKDYLINLTKEPHPAGTDEDEVVLVEYIEDVMKKAEMEVKISEYEVLLSYPQSEDGMRNYVAILHENGTLIEESKSAEVEEILSDSQNNTNVLNPFM